MSPASSPRVATTEACAPRAYALQQEKSLQRDAHAPEGVTPTCHHQKKPVQSNEDPAQPKVNDFLKNRECQLKNMKKQ